MTQMSIFRAAEAPLLSDESDEYQMSLAPMSDSTASGLDRLVKAGIENGSVTKVLFSIPGFSLIYSWFKPNYPLPRHSHNTDCLYYIISGSMKLGTNILQAGDGFFLPNYVPYTYAVGNDGLEILEFRHTGKFDFRATGGTEAYWSKAVASVIANRDGWNSLASPRAAHLAERQDGSR